MPEPLELKKTLNLPKTDFPMKASLPLNEPKQLAAWQESHLYERILAAREGKPLFVLHDGPPYPTGEIHLGTGLNKILKDLVVKTKSMAGHYAPYVPGWDCHGLPIETKVEKELGGKGKVPPAEFRSICREFAARFVEQHKKDFKRLGIFGRWNEPYLTMNFEYEAVIAGAFLEFMEKGYVYRGRKPVYWCLHDSTALAEAEVEYEDHVSPSIWVKFAVVGGGSGEAAKVGGDVSAVIWTTTPWTIPHNRGLAFHPDFEYAVVETEKGKLLLAADRVAALQAECGIKDARVVATFKGRDFEGMKFQHPFLPMQVPGVLATYVTLDQGSGIVHTAPGHGVDDFNTGQKYGLEVAAPLDDRGRYTEGLPEYKGKDVFTANPIIVKLLGDRGALLGHHNYKHSYPHCWRCHNPVIFRATEQWFIGMEMNHFRQDALEAIKRVKWMPEWGQERISNMIAVRPDWCISRQRVWGVPIIVFYCEGCREPVTDRKILDPIVSLFAEHTADVWYERTAAELLPAGHTCAKCGATEFAKETDILDVWFDSGSSHLAVLNESFGLPWPADVYLEGGDQYRGWFHSSLLVGTGLRGSAPYRECLLNGWVLDGEGKAMHKSLGNAVDPETIIKDHGADILRLWTASVEFNEDVRMSATILTRLVDAYRKLRNTFRYMLGNLAGFDPATDAVPASEMEELDQWMLLRAEDLVARCRAWYDNFEFHKIYHAVYAFCTVDLSAVYFDVLKDRLYTSAPKSLARRSAQTALYRMLDAFVRLLAPLMSFTAEEVWGHMGRAESVHMAYFPEPAELSAGLDDAARKRTADWDRLMEVRDVVLKHLDTARNQKLIGAPLEARVRLRANGDLYTLLEQYAAQLPALFIVSQVELEPAEGTELGVKVERAAGDKCERCWKYTLDVGGDATFPTVCLPCAGAVREILHG